MKLEVKSAQLADDRVSSYRDLIVWQKAMDLVDMIYGLSRSFPSSEDYRITAQITRAVVSIPANIAEGQARSTRRDFANFLMMAKGSLNETDTLLTVAVRQGFVTDAATKPAYILMTEVSKMLTVLRRKLLGVRDG